MNKLDQFLRDNPEIAEAFHKRIGVSRQAVYRYRTAIRIPGASPMRKIYVESGGFVDPNSFYDLPPLRPASKRREARAVR